MIVDDHSARVNAALADYAARGWRVHPVHGIRNGRCTCNRADCEHPGKHPRLHRWPEQATTELRTIHRWWAWWPTSNLGTAIGGGRMVLDVDGEVGAESLRDLERRYGALPETPRAISGGGGHHHHFAVEGIVGNRVRIAPGIDVRGDRGFVVAPPSLHVSGRRYAWDLAAHPDDLPLAAAPGWVLDLCAQPAPRTSAAPGDELHLIKGERNHGLFREACRWRRAGIGRAAIGEMLQVVNRHHVDPPLLKRELVTIATSAAKYMPAVEDDGHDDLALAQALGVTE
jgi:hypothetical protein